ncbi:PLD nuclease N-terminal domain-containing protein [Arthrobacter crystallopoietes]|uniref:PLD nuclease N-terminal domain-containing protein n=1 Tax=Crystallibacter crystallopoietes TaxID=37928 RepID=UPI003D23E503
MVRVYILLVVVAVAVIVYALIECIRSRPQEVRSISKPAWILTILVVPLIGALLWFLFGRPRSTPQPQVQQRRPMAPDDDVAFLRKLEHQRRQQQREAERQKREREAKKREQGGAADKLGEQDPENPGPR